MNNITTTHTNNITQRSSLKIDTDKIEFCEKLDKLNNELKDKLNDKLKNKLKETNSEQKENDGEIISDTHSVEKEIIYSQDLTEKEKDQSPSDLLLNLPQEILSISTKNNLNIPNTVSTTAIQSLEEISTFIDKHYLSTHKINTSVQNEWNFSYTDDIGINIDFRLKKATTEQFQLSCNVNFTNMKKHLHDLNERLNKKGWSLISESSNVDFKIIKVTQN
ncbi:MAG: hypothetical protein P8163_19380 [Candidatus Thiodiazotropha sp.]